MKLHDTDSASAYLEMRFGIVRRPGTLSKYRVLGVGPEFRRIGTREVAYEEQALEAWARRILGQPMRSTSEFAA